MNDYSQQLQNHLLKMVEVDENFKKRRLGRNRKKKFIFIFHYGLLEGIECSSPWRRKWQPAPVCLPGESHGRGAWWAIV